MDLPHQPIRLRHPLQQPTMTIQIAIPTSAQETVNTTKSGLPW
jgi:hypothetical protein